MQGSFVKLGNSNHNAGIIDGKQKENNLFISHFMGLLEYFFVCCIAVWCTV